MVSTTDMLAEIGSGTAAELALGVRYNTSPPGPTFIPDLDEILLTARPHPGGSALRRGDLVELVGGSGSGKTTLSAFMLMTTLLPSSVRVPLDHPFHALPEIDVPLGGRGMYATFLRPASHKCILPLLRASMEHHIHSCITTTFSLHDIKYWSAASEPVARAIEYIIDEALARLTLMTVRPRSLGWTMALRRLLHDRAVDYVVLDGLSDGFWPERWAEESGPRRVGDIRAEAGWRDTWDAITALRRDAGAVVVITTHGLRSIPNTPFYKPHLPPPFPSPWVQRFDTPEPPQAWGLSIQITLLGRMRSLQFPAETTLVDALRARKDPGGEYAAIVRVPHTPTEGRFSFGIAPHGLVPFTKE